MKFLCFRIQKGCRLPFRIFILALACASSGAAQTAPAAAPAVSLVPKETDLVKVWTPNGVRLKAVEVVGQPFERALSIETSAKTKDYWGAQAMVQWPVAVPEGATVEVRLQARSAGNDANDGATASLARFTLTLKARGNVHLNDKTFEVGPEWTPVLYSYKMPRAVRGKVEINAGWQAQTLEVADFQMSFSGGDATSVTRLEESERAAQTAATGAATANIAAAMTPRSPQALAPNSYYAKLKEEFKGVGEAYFVTSNSEDETLNRLPGEKIEVAGQPFSRALRVKTEADKFTSMWQVNVNTTNKEPVSKGETLLLIYYARGRKAPQIVDDGAGPVLGPLLWQRTPYEAVSHGWPKQEITDEWQRYWAVSESPKTGVGPVNRDFPAGQLDLNFNFGFKNQTVEIGGVALMAFKNADINKLPQQTWDYFGRDPKAPWRAEAARRIEQHRKGDLKVVVVDAKGKPMPDAQVQVAMTRNAFNFGVAGSASRLLDPKQPEYQANLLKYFNTVGFTNDLKWIGMEDWGLKPETTLAAMQMLKANGKSIRGHVLVWPSFSNSPKRLQALKDKPQELQAEILKHITATVTRTKDYISDWDVTNETEGNAEFMKIIGPQAMIEWYQAARAADPKAILTFTEPAFDNHGIEEGSFPNKELPGYRGWVDYLIKNKAPLDSLGTQAHSGILGRESTHGAFGVWKSFDELAARYGKTLQYTELDIALKKPGDPVQQAYQADRLRDSLIIAYAHPAVTGAMQWGYWEGDVWQPGTGLWNKDWTIKPIGQAYVDLVTKEWWTQAEGKTDAKGTYSTRGFTGNYDITVVADGKSQTLSATLPKEGATMTIVLR
jgi:GH35 family endo-1,4-beta-xylanase